VPHPPPPRTAEPTRCTLLPAADAPLPERPLLPPIGTDCALGESGDTGSAAAVAGRVEREPDDAKLDAADVPEPPASEAGRDPSPARAMPRVGAGAGGGGGTAHSQGAGSEHEKQHSASIFRYR
jgi:hypothetical protein